jgi:hypothetical protein
MFGKGGEGGVDHRLVTVAAGYRRLQVVWYDRLGTPL